MKSFWDLNVSATPSSAITSVFNRFEYEGIAYNKIIKKPSESEKCSFKPIDFIPITQSSCCRLRQDDSSRFLQKSRVTVLLSEQSDVFNITSQNSVYQSFDLIAVNPSTEQLFNQCCCKLDVDIISLDLSQKLPFFLKPALINVAISRGLFFELSFSPLIRDQGHRKTFFSNAQQLVQLTKGRNIILTSGAQNVMEVRSPYDVMNLGILFGLNQQSARLAVSENPYTSLQHGFIRRQTHSGVVEVISSNNLRTSEKWMTENLSNT